MLFYILIVLCAIILVVAFKFNDYWKKRNIVQAGDLIWKFSTNHKSLAEICKTIYDEHNVPHIGTSMGKVPTLIVKNLEDIQAVFAGDFQSFHSRGIVINENDLLADNILFINNFPRWKLIRQKLSPVFTSSRLKNMFYIIEKCARDFVQLLEDNQHLRKKTWTALTTYTTSSMGASVFGIDTRTRNTMDSPFLDMTHRAVNPSLRINVTFFIANMFPRLFKLLNLKIFSEFEDFFISVVKNVLEKRNHDTEKRYDFIEICLELQKHGMMQDFATGFELKPTDELLAAQAFFFFIAGSDTSASTLNFTLLELASNKMILHKLHDEIDGIFTNKTEELTYGDIEKLTYLDMVINEAMRKYPPIGFIQRMCTKDTVLPTENIKIEKDTAIVIPVFAIHRDEKYYPNPDKFDPERFSHDNASNIPKYAYIPFGEGHRICIGVRYARLQLKAGLAWLLRRFTLAEQNYKPEHFERSSFAIRDSGAHFDLIPRDV